MSASVQTLCTAGSSAIVVDIECTLSNNLPNIVIVGSASRTVAESRERIRGSFASSRIMLPRKRITVNLAPADIPKGDSGFDLAIAVSILLADGQLAATPGTREAFIGELGLDGRTRAVRGIIGKLLSGRSRGISTFFIPTGNLAQARLVPDITLLPVRNLSELYLHLTKTAAIPPVLSEGQPSRTHVAARHYPSLSTIVGQRLAKQALEIAAAGGHNLLLSGPPGTGKTMLARALPGLLPPMSPEEILEATHLHSLTRPDYDQIVAERPFRAPHHSASLTAITGAGSGSLRPGEISLAHRGILCLDELPEFKRDAIEALRQPLEDGTIRLARAKETVEYPTDFLLVATANPCPCGFNGISARCQCDEYELKRYRQRLSSPILDRIDLYCAVHEVEHNKLLAATPDPAADTATTERIAAARRRQAARYGSPHKLNAHMTHTDIRRHASLRGEALSRLNTAAHNLNLSARAYLRTVKIARTIADLDGSEGITAAHVTEALTYRSHTLRE